MNQASMFAGTGSVLGHAAKTARSGLFLSTRDQQSINHRVPKEWAGLTEDEREAASLPAFKRGSRGTPGGV